MSRRREANRAETIIRAVGAFIMVLVLAVMVFTLPKGQNADELIKTVLHRLIALTLIGLTFGIAALVVRFIVPNKRK